MSLLSLTDISFRENDESFSLKEISLEASSGARVAIIGETGSGKTTLLKVIAGLISAESGTMVFNGEALRGPDWQLIPGHKGIAYLSQHFELPHNYRMEELLAYSEIISREEAAAIYEACRITHLFSRKSNELSGGEKQRVALAKLLVSTPTLLLLDEPFSQLDLKHKKILKTVLEDVASLFNITMMMASHDPRDILPWAGHVFVLHDGRIVQHGGPEEIYYRPVNEYTAELLGPFSLIDQNAFSSFDMSNFYLLDNKIFLRPEVPEISDAVDAVPFVVESCEFHGSRYLIRAKNPAFSLSLYSRNSYERGAIIKIGLR